MDLNVAVGENEKNLVKDAEARGQSNVCMRNLFGGDPVLKCFMVDRPDWQEVHQFKWRCLLIE